MCLYVCLTMQTGVFQDWVEMGGNAPSTSNHSYTLSHTGRAGKTELSRQKLSGFLHNKDINHGCWFAPTCTCCACPPQLIKLIQNTNKRQHRTTEKWLIELLMVYQLSMVITTNCQEIMCNESFKINLLVCVFYNVHMLNGIFYKYVQLLSCLEKKRFPSSVIEGAQQEAAQRGFTAVPCMSGVFLYHHVHLKQPIMLILRHLGD